VWSVTRASDPLSGLIAMPLARGCIGLLSERDCTAGLRRRKGHPRVAPRHRAPFQQLAQAIRTDLGAALAWTTLTVSNGALEGMTTTGEATRSRACDLPATWTWPANGFEQLREKTAQTEANTEGNEHGTVDDVSVLHARLLPAEALRPLRR